MKVLVGAPTRRLPDVRVLVVEDEVPLAEFIEQGDEHVLAAAADANRTAVIAQRANRMVEEKRVGRVDQIEEDIHCAVFFR